MKRIIRKEYCICLQHLLSLYYFYYAPFSATLSSPQEEMTAKRMTKSSWIISGNGKKNTGKSDR